MQPVLHDDPDASPRVPERVYLALPDDACQLEGAGATLSGASTSTPATATAGRGPTAVGASPGEALVARWCEAWGDERPSRVTQRAMAEDIDRAVTLAVGVALQSRVATSRRGGAARVGRSPDQLPLALGVPRAEGGSANDPHSPATSAPARGRSAGADATVRPAATSVSALADHGAVGAKVWARYDAYLVRLWSTAKVAQLAMLASDPSGLPVVLLPEPGNEVDAEAVALAVERSEEEAGGLGVEGLPQLRAVAYVARAEARKPALFAGLSTGRVSARGRLHLEQDGWYLHLVRPTGGAPGG